MAISLDDVRHQLEDLKTEHEERHDEHRRLRDFWHGRHWEMQQDGNRTLDTLFRDLGSQSDVGPDAKIVHNIVQAICVKYQTYLSPTPSIRVYTDPPESEQRKAQATSKERALYALWGDVGMSRVLTRAAWFLPLMGDCFLGIHPDFDRSVPVPMLRSPEHAFPVASFDGQSLESVTFKEELRESVAKSTFPGYQPAARKPGRVLGRNRGSSDPKVEVIEYSDKDCWYRWVDGQKVNGVEHQYGFNLYGQIPFIDVPDEAWNHGAVEQIVGMNLMHDALLSLLFQAVMENVFPITVIEDAAKLPETLDKGPGAVWPVNAGGKVYTVSPPVQAIGAQVGFMENNVRNMEQTAGMPPVNFGQSPASSIVTGKAINELQGAGSGSLVEMVQGNVGPELARWNSNALFMWQTMFRDDKVKVGGTIPTTIYDLKGRTVTCSFKGKEIVGGQNNDVVFQPALGQHEKLVMGLQAKGAGLVSNQYVRNQIGIEDSDAMDEEIIAETIQAALIGAALQALQTDPSTEGAASAEAKAFAALAGQAASGPPAAGQTQPGQPPAGPGSPLMLQNMPPPSAPAPAQGSGASPAPAGNPSPADPGLPAPPDNPGHPASDRTVTVDQVAQLVSGAQVQGQVFIVGELAQRGQTDNDIELAVTVPDDRDPIAQALGDLRARVVFHVVQKEPSEPHLDITPGAQAGGGASPAAPGFPTPPPAPPGQAAQPVLAGATQ